MGKLATVGIACLLIAAPGFAVESGVGRTVPGVWIQPQGGVVGPSPGFSFTTMPIGYVGSSRGSLGNSTLGGGLLVPVAGSIFANVGANVSSNYLATQYVYKTETSKVNLASSAIVVINWVGSAASLQLNGVSLSMGSSNGGLGDLILAPLTVGIHFSENNNLAISTKIFAPTGQYRPGNLSNLGAGAWTITPSFAHTYLCPKLSLEFDNFVGFDIYGENATTKYTSGTMFHWDGMAIQYLSKRVGLGAIGSNLTQITNDTGPAADTLHGFEGRAWGVGPVAVYVAKLEKPGVILQLRWVKEFDVTNLLKGNMFVLGLTLKAN